jgi:PAS domain S-box-containing protein
MRIKTRLLLNAFLPLLAAIIILAIILLNYKEDTVLQKQDMIVQEVRTGIFELKQLTNNYLLYREERPKRQWELRYRELAETLEGLELELPARERRVGRVRTDLDLMRAFFLQLVSTYENDALPIDPVLEQDLQARLMGMLLLRARVVQATINELAFRVDEDRAALMRRNNTIIIATLLVLAIVIAATLLRLNRSIIGSLARLRRGTEIVGAGDLDHRLGFAGSDEFSGLAHAFDRMTEELQRTTVSRDKLRQSEEKFHFIATNIPGIIFFQDQELRYVWLLNPPPSLQESQVVGKKDADLLPSEQAERLTEIKSRVLETGAGIRTELQLSPGGVTRWYEAVYEPSRDSHGRIIGVVSYSRDITERKREEEERERLIAELARSNLELEQFAYIASHDLQTPLRSVTGFLGLLSHRYKNQLGPEADEFISFAVEGAERMHQLINGILAFSRVGTRGKPFEHLDSREAIDWALRSLKADIDESGAEITYGDLPTVLADRDQIAQLFQNLIGNAIKYRKPGEPPRIHIDAAEKDSKWEFRVRDNGIGFDPQYAEQIFQVFKRLHTVKEYAGTGIGLAICKKIVERHGGDIWVESEPGEGSTFYFTLPRA